MLFPDLEEPDMVIRISNNVQNAGIILGFPVLGGGVDLSSIGGECGSFLEWLIADYYFSRLILC